MTLLFEGGGKKEGDHYSKQGRESHPVLLVTNDRFCNDHRVVFRQSVLEGFLGIAIPDTSPLARFLHFFLLQFPTPIVFTVSAPVNRPG